MLQKLHEAPRMFLEAFYFKLSIPKMSIRSCAFSVLFFRRGGQQIKTALALNLIFWQPFPFPRSGVLWILFLGLALPSTAQKDHALLFSLPPPSRARFMTHYYRRRSDSVGSGTDYDAGDTAFRSHL